MDQATRQATNRQLVTCSHGISTSQSCWWCETTKNKPLEERIDVLEKRMSAMLNVVQLLIKAPHLQGSNGAVVSNVVNNITQGGDTLIQSGLDADKPNDNALAFYMATDTDTIYQRRNDQWMDITVLSVGTTEPTAPDTGDLWVDTN